MTDCECEQLLHELRRACHGYAAWAADEAARLGQHNGTGDSLERANMRAQWDRLMADVDYQAARRVLAELERGTRPWPPFGQLPMYVRLHAGGVQHQSRTVELQLARRHESQVFRESLAKVGPVDLVAECERLGLGQFAASLTARRKTASKRATRKPARQKKETKPQTHGEH